MGLNLDDARASLETPEMSSAPRDATHRLWRNEANVLCDIGGQTNLAKRTHLLSSLLPRKTALAIPNGKRRNFLQNHVGSRTPHFGNGRKPLLTIAFGKDFTLTIGGKAIAGASSSAVLSPATEQVVANAPEPPRVCRRLQLPSRMEL